MNYPLLYLIYIGCNAIASVEFVSLSSLIQSGQLHSNLDQFIQNQNYQRILNLSGENVFKQTGKKLNNISGLPEFCNAYPFFDTINLSGNEISDIKEFLAKIVVNVRYIDLSRNKIKDGTIHIMHNDTIEGLNLSHNQLESVNLHAASNLAALDLSHNNINNVTITEAPKYLNVSHNNLTTFPTIKSSHLYRRYLADVAKKTLVYGGTALLLIAGARKIDTCSLYLTQMAQMYLNKSAAVSNLLLEHAGSNTEPYSTFLSDLVQYYQMDAESDSVNAHVVRFLGKQVALLGICSILLGAVRLYDGARDTRRQYLYNHLSLEYLNLSHNNITEIPNDIDYYEKLKKILLHNNAIKCIPYAFLNLNKIQEVTLYNNPLDGHDQFKYYKSPINNYKMCLPKMNFLKSLLYKTKNLIAQNGFFKKLLPKHYQKPYVPFTSDQKKAFKLYQYLERLYIENTLKTFERRFNPLFLPFKDQQAQDMALQLPQEIVQEINKYLD